MKNQVIRKALPHVIAIAVFVIVSLLFCKPALEGNVLNQHDIVGWKGMTQDALEYKAQKGHLPLWNPNLFSGMPNYQVNMEGKSILPDIGKIATFGLPKPINYFLLSCICFYILCLSLGTNAWIGVLGGLAFAFTTYNPVIIAAGHESKMLAIAYMPLILAGLINVYEKRYWTGLALTTFGASAQLGAGHPQISYYFFLVAAAVTISYLVIWIKRQEWKHLAISMGIVVISGLVALAANALTLMTSSEYSKYTMRGGKNIAIEGNNVSLAKTSGLDTSYAFRYSILKAETFTVMMPNAFGSSSGKGLDEDSRVVEKLVEKGYPEGNAMQIATGLPAYWGGMSLPGESTSGPQYYGAIICILALIGFVVYKHPLRWGLLAVSLLGIMMAWGKYLPGFNSFLFNSLPLYDKFRAPSMALVITGFTIPIVACICLQYLLFRENARELLKKEFKTILYAVGVLFGLLILLYLMMDFSAPGDRFLAQSITEQAKNEDLARSIIEGMKLDRKAMFGGQMLRALGFAVLVVGLLYLYMKNLVKPLLVIITLALVTIIDLFVIGKEYLNEDNYRMPEELNTEHFAATPIDNQILQDKDPNFRVFNLAGDTYNEARTSYYHKSVGGYHPAKLRIYQDVIERYLSGNPNQGVMNMLNTKYIIVRDPQTGQPGLIQNPEAYGNCWFVKHVQVVKDPVAAIQSLEKTNLKDTAIVEESFAKFITQPQPDSLSTIRMTKFDNDTLEYEANCTGNQFAVFSEVYYPKGWNAYIDGKKVDYVNADYILRGLSIPSGKHVVKFVFEPESYKKGKSLMFISSFIILAFILAAIYMAWRKSRQTAAA